MMAEYPNHKNHMIYDRASSGYLAVCRIEEETIAVAKSLWHKLASRYVREDDRQVGTVGVRDMEAKSQRFKLQLKLELRAESRVVLSGLRLQS